MEAPVLNTQNEQVDTVALSESIFAAPVNAALLWEVVRMQLANRRRGTHQVKNRSAVRGGGRKPWRQKGTGRARAGSRSSVPKLKAVAW
jgi:large subunit ribosomal protein L4